MRRGNLADLAAFVVLADQLSFRVAAARLDVTPSALSHSMRQLESHLGVRLLHRTTRSVSVTDAGLRLLERLRPAIGEISGALDDLGEAQRRPSGRLRIHAVHLAAAMVIAPVWGRFLSTHPDVQIELLVDDAPIDIVAKGFDAGIGARDDAAGDMVAVRVTGRMRVAVVGAPAYFALQRPPRTPDDLAHHNCIQYRRATDAPLYGWSFSRAGEERRMSVEGRVIVSNPDMAVRAALDALGVTYTLESLAAPFLRSGQLVRVLEDWSPSCDGLFLYYSGRRQVPAALRAFIDMVSEAGVNAVASHGNAGARVAEPLFADDRAQA